MPSPALITRLRRRLARWRRAEEGATAVEFAMVALPFFALLFGIIELGMIFVLSTTLDNATSTAARTIRTGQLQSTGTATAASFRTTICNNLGWLAADCPTNLKVDVEVADTFAKIDISDPIKPDKSFDDSKIGFAAGGPEQIVVVRSYYQWQLFTPMLSQAVAKLGNGKTLITSTAAFRNEPYS